MRARNAIQQQERVWQHQQAQQGRTWHQLQRRYLHPHYAVGILDETINQPNDSIQSAINRAIAGRAHHHKHFFLLYIIICTNSFSPRRFLHRCPQILGDFQ
jgi:hypothetical protein